MSKFGSVISQYFGFIEEILFNVVNNFLFIEMYNGNISDTSSTGDI